MEHLCLLFLTVLNPGKLWQIFLPGKALGLGVTEVRARVQGRSLSVALRYQG